MKKATTPLRSWMVAAILVFAPVMMVGSSKEPAPAPLPGQIAVARKAFISNGGESPLFKQFGLHRSYDQFYSSMKDWGRLEIVTSPSEADIVFEIRLVSQLERYGDTLQNVPFLRLGILDPKTGITLWEFSEELETGGMVGIHQDAKFDKAMERILADVKEMFLPPPSPPAAAKP